MLKSLSCFFASALVLFVNPVFAEDDLQETIVGYTPVFISSQDAEKVGRKIWINECRGTVDGLTSWNLGEDFASLGIGHFIWYPENQEGPFKEMFPGLLLFFAHRGVSMPLWLKEAKGCPWASRDEFLLAQESPQMVELRKLLAETIALQAEFMAFRLQKSLPLMVSKFPDESRSRMLKHFQLLLKEPQGLYAVLDYLNFKGEGLLMTEAYNNEGWGLIQVLELMGEPGSQDSEIKRFTAAANVVLERRVANSPPERNEKRWLKGWQNRLQTYLN